MTNLYNFLVVDDVLSELSSTLQVIKSEGHNVVGVQSTSEALQVLKNQPIDVLITDLHLNEKQGIDHHKPEGLDLLQDVQSLHPEVIPLAMSKDIKKSLWDRALAYGALNFIKKPIASFDDISVNLSLAKSRRSLKVNLSSKNICDIPKHLRDKHPDGLVFESHIRDTIHAIAKHPSSTLLVIGETGTGKEEIAKLLYRERCILEGDIPFIEVNCSHLGTDLAHAKLFGHAKGAFTGAVESNNGIIAEANGGILFLDEFHMMPKQCQNDLLRVLNDGSYQRLGETKTLYSRFQVVIASPLSLEAMNSKKIISLDLTTRLMGISIELKPLRDRPDDIADLVELFFSRNNKKVAKKSMSKIIEKCRSYYWQGNIRMLLQALQTLILKADIQGEAYSEDHLPDFELMRDPKNANNQPVSETLLGMVLEGSLSLEQAVNLFEKNVIEKTRNQSRNIGDLAKRLKLSRSTLDSKRKKHGIM